MLASVQALLVFHDSVVNIALPSIRDDLGFAQASVAWVVKAYVLAFGGLLLVAARLVDVVGRKRMLSIGLGIFGLSSLLSISRHLPASSSPLARDRG